MNIKVSFVVSDSVQWRCSIPTSSRDWERPRPTIASDDEIVKGITKSEINEFSSWIEVSWSWDWLGGGSLYNRLR